MTDTKKNDRCGKMKWFVIGSALTLVGFIIVPPLIKKYGSIGVQGVQTRLKRNVRFESK